MLPRMGQKYRHLLSAQIDQYNWWTIKINVASSNMVLCLQWILLWGINFDGFLKCAADTVEWTLKQRPSALTTLCSTAVGNISTWICFQSPVSRSVRWFQSISQSQVLLCRGCISVSEPGTCCPVSYFGHGCNKMSGEQQLLWVDSLRQAAVLPRHKLHLLPRGLPCLRPSSCRRTDHLWENLWFLERGRVSTQVWGLLWLSAGVNWQVGGGGCPQNWDISLGMSSFQSHRCYKDVGSGNKKRTTVYSWRKESKT